MRADLLIKGRSLTGTSDLTLFAPLKRGLVPSLEAMSYKTRTARLLKLLQGGRVSLHEHALSRPLSDAVERVARIHSVRVCIVEPDDRVMLAVAFDGTWESYIRVLWQKVGPLLDVIFCNTEGYVLSSDGYEAWCGWVRRVQTETAFFFSTHGLTVDDVHWQRGADAARRAAATPEEAALVEVRHRVESAEAIARRVGQTTTRPALDAVRQGLQSLALLFRLTELYLPGTDDGEVLQRAARDLLAEFRPLVADPDLLPELIAPIRRRFGRQLDWLNGGTPDRTRHLPTLDAEHKALPDDPADVQAGMLHGYARCDAGALVWLAFAGADAKAQAAAGRRFIERALGALHTEATPAARATFAVNLALSAEGLRKLGLGEELLAQWPQEFREGMEARASVLGDYRMNHPRRWRLPQRNWRPDSPVLAADPKAPPVATAAVHAVLHFRCRLAAGEERLPAQQLPKAIHDRLVELASRDATVLMVQPMRRQKNRQGQAAEHFGFADGFSQPRFERAAVRSDGQPWRYDNRAALGELLLGYPNEADFAPPRDEADPRSRLLHNGSFMVVRKLRQDVAEFRRVAAAAAAAAGQGVAPELVEAKMMGRWHNGSPLHGAPDAAGPPATGAEANDFDFGSDAQGERCPIHSHIRRSNPRFPARPAGQPPGARRARLVRRGMSYGPALSADEGNAAEDRGLVFIAFNASIAEQFELVQRWISGGNGSGGYSGHADPLLGVPEPGQQRRFAFEHGGRRIDVPLDRAPEVFREHEARPLVRLEWGQYLFVPSISALKWLATQPPAQAVPWTADAGRARIAALQALEAKCPHAALAAWKVEIEDPQASEQLATASFWAAVRQHHGGVLRTAYGVLVADPALIDGVLKNDRQFSVRGYRQRMVESRFDIFLGLDDGPRYRQLASRVNAAIGQLPEDGTFELARGAADAVLSAFVAGESALAHSAGAQRWELNIDVREVGDRVLSVLCQAWLGVAHHATAQPREKGELLDGSWRWNWAPPQPPLCPAHFTPPSRYFFQPHPGDEVRQWGERCAAALADALTATAARHRRGRTLPQSLPDKDGKTGDAFLAKAVFDALPHEPDDTVGRTLAGVMMGFLPTLDGCARLVLNEWLRLGTFWELRAAWLADDEAPSHAKARRLLMPAMTRALQFRGTPELIWRTAVGSDAKVGDVALADGEIVVLALTSATQAQAERGSDDLYALFGGDRSQDGAPTHACPGYTAAIGALLGLLAGWVGCRHTLRASPAPLAFTLEGPAPGKLPAPPPSPPPSPPPPSAYDDAAPPAGKPLLLALGDSWFAYWPKGDILDVIDTLDRWDTRSFAWAGCTLPQLTQGRDADPAKGEGERRPQTLALADWLANASMADRERVQAIAISIGGNDVAADDPTTGRHRLLSLVRPYPGSARGVKGAEWLDMEKVDAFVNGHLRTGLHKLIRQVLAMCEQTPGLARVPVLLHGYDYPVPDGRSAVRDAWLEKPLLERGYERLADRVAVMRLLIDELNAMQRSLALALNASAGFDVRWVDLRGTLSCGADHALDWQNELHPSIPRGFEKVAAKFAAALPQPQAAAAAD